MEKLEISDYPPVPEEINNKEVLSAFIVNSLGLFPKKGKGDVAIKMLLILCKIAGKREEKIRIGQRDIFVKNGAIRVEDLHHALREMGVEIGLSQLYTTYISRFQKAGLIVKKKHSMYGLRADSLADTVREITRDVRSIMEKIEEHARRLDVITRNR